MSSKAVSLSLQPPTFPRSQLHLILIPSRRERKPHASSTPPRTCVHVPTQLFTMALFTLILFLFLLLLNVSSFTEEDTTNSLLKFKDSLQDTNNALSSWNSSTSPCTGDRTNWSGVLCYKGHVWGFQLENMNLKGFINVDSLKGLPYLRTISLMNNDFDTTWPELNRLVGLKAIYLSNNKFYGEVPDEAFHDMQWLKRIYLSNNHFSGPIPTSLASLPRLMDLKLDGNGFNGPIPQFRQTFKSFNVARNKLEGEIPSTLSNIPASSFSGNEGLCGVPLGSCSSKKESSINVSLVVVVILVSVAVLVIAAVILFVLVKRRKQREETGARAVRSSARSGDSNTQHKDGSTIPDDQGSVRSRASSHSSGKSDMKLSFMRGDISNEFDLQDLLKANAEILGSGCYSSSYKAALVNGPTVVVKRFKQMNNVRRDDFREHMRRLGRLSHQNLLPLLAYYYRREEKLLVSEYIHNGSLAVRLHGYQAIGEASLDWPTRLKIVKGVGKGLEYLYKELPSQIAAHGHLKSSNILLRETMEPVLTDYGLVPVINQDLAPEIMVIYKSPEYLQHGRISKKTDVWSFGILILEILTGKFPSNFLQQGGNKEISELSLANWVESVVPEKWSSEVFDKDMREVPRNSEGEMVKLLRIALACCEADVDKRWDLKEAVERIEEVKENSIDDDDYEQEEKED